MTPAIFSSNLIRRRLGKLSAHIVVALIALVVIGGATRVMEAGLACPDWPLCFGSFLPIGEMNAKVFLEWFHRLDAFFIGTAITLQLLFSLIYSSVLPRWLPWMNLIILLLVVFQGALGALTVINLLPSSVVIGHLFLALTLVALMSGLSQKLLLSNGTNSPFWWKLCSGGSLLLILSQSLLGSRMATTWAAQKCIANGTFLCIMTKLQAARNGFALHLFPVIIFYQQNKSLRHVVFWAILGIVRDVLNRFSNGPELAN